MLYLVKEGKLREANKSEAIEFASDVSLDFATVETVELPEDDKEDIIKNHMAFVSRRTGKFWFVKTKTLLNG